MTPTFFLLNKITKSEKRKGNDMEEKKEKIKRICELANGLNRREWILIEKEIEKRFYLQNLKTELKVDPEELYKDIEYRIEY